MNNMNTSKYCYYCIISSFSVSSSEVAPVKNTHKAVLWKCSVLTLLLNVCIFITCFASHWTCRNRMWRDVNDHIRFYVGNIHSLRPGHILGNYTPKTGLVCTRWTNRIIKSLSFEYTMVRTATKMSIFSSSLASLHFSVMLYSRERKFQKTEMSCFKVSEESILGFLFKLIILDDF